MRAAVVVGSVNAPRRLPRIPRRRLFPGGRRLNTTRTLHVAAAGRETGNIVGYVSPHERLGVSKNADQKEIKRAFRRLALKHHPDREGGSEANFLLVVEAYEILTGKHAGKEHTDKGSWDYHDWFWKFAINRRKGRSSGSRKGATFSQGQMQSQLAGLRHRAAVRAHRCHPMTSSSDSDTHDPASEVDMSKSTAVPDPNSTVLVNDSSIDFEDYVDSGDSPSDAGCVSAAPEGSRAAAERAQEETRRRVALNGTDAKASVSSQLEGLRRKSALHQHPSDGQEWAFL